MINKNFWVGIIVGLICVTLIARDIGRRINTPIVVSNSLEEATSISEDNFNPDPTSSLIPLASVKASPKPSPKIVLATPAPTPTPLPDYFAGEINVYGAYGNNVSFDEADNLSGMTVNAKFHNNAQTDGTGDLHIRMFQDGNIRYDDIKPKFSNSSVIYSYRPSIEVGSHAIKFIINENKLVAESNYGNNEITVNYTVNGDKIAPTFTLDGPYSINNQTCMRWINLQDNKSVYTDVWAKWKIDDGSWSNRTSENPYGCDGGTSGSSHTYYVHAEDYRGNAREDSRVFTLY